MRRFLLLAVAVGLAAPVGLAQWVENLAVPTSGFVTPGDGVLAQKLLVHNEQGRVGSPSRATGGWSEATAAMAWDGVCAYTSAAGSDLYLEFGSFGIPNDAKILGISVHIVGAVEGEGGGGVSVALMNQGRWLPHRYGVELPAGDCGNTRWASAGGMDQLWGKSWTPAMVNEGTTVRLTAVLPSGSTVHVDCVRLIFWVGLPDTITEVRVRNTYFGPASTVLEGAHISKIELVRASDGRIVGSQSTSSELAKFTTTGVRIAISTGYRQFTGVLELQIRITLKTTVPVRKCFELGETYVTFGGREYLVDYWQHPAAWFEVGPPPTVGYDGLVEGTEVYRGQRFLAGRIVVNASVVPFELTISQVRLLNVGAPPKLTGSSISKLEIRRARDDALLGEASSAELAKLTSTGTVITTSSNNKVPAYEDVQLEIWVTLKADAPASHYLKLAADVRCGGTDFWAGSSNQFTVGEPGGLAVANLDLPDLSSGQVFSGQRFLAQRVEVRDDDLDPYDVMINSLVVQNVADPVTRLGEGHIVRIEVIRARDGAAMGSVTGTSGLNSGGVRITAGTNNIVRDDTTEVIELWVTLGPNVPDGRGILLRTVIWHTEDAKTFGRPPGGLDSAAEFTTGPATGQGFEQKTADAALVNRTVFQGARFLAQRLKLRDEDPDPYDVLIASLMIRNAETASPLADQHVAKVEVRRKADGMLLGEVTDPVGLSLAGVRVTVTANNLVPDDTSVELEIWITLKTTAPAGRKLQLKTVVWHTEGAATHPTPDLVGPATFTTDIGDPPTGVDFTWAPTAPEANQEITFTPAAGITDPEGNIANATFAWTMGDGTTKQTTGSAPVKHTYTRGGTFTVTLTVTGQGGLSASKSRQITVKGREPTVDFTYTPATPMAGQEVAFTSQVTDPANLGPYTYAWDFGDGTTSTAANPRHTYATAGTYTVTLAVTNSRGETGRATKTITVAERRDLPPTVTALTASPANPEVGQEVTFSAVATAPEGDPVTGWEWDFGDGSAVSTTTTSTAKHAFTTTSVFTVRVRARNAQGGWSQPRTLSLYVRPRGGALVGTKLLDNPARTQARIEIYLPTGATNVRIQIFDMLGRLVVEKAVAGTSVTWDLKDAGGRRVADGLYSYLVTATVAGKTERSEVGKILVLR